jgi:hypothetical protein
MPPTKGDLPALETIGLPSAGGRLDWPLGFRLLPRNSEAPVWQQQIDSLLPVAVEQAATGQATAATSQEISRALDNLAALLQSRATNMPAATYYEADQFLKRVAESLTQLR